MARRDGGTEGRDGTGRKEGRGGRGAGVTRYTGWTQWEQCPKAKEIESTNTAGEAGIYLGDARSRVVAGGARYCGPPAFASRRSSRRSSRGAHHTFAYAES